MADKDLTIKVTTSADTAGADAATEAVKQATEATKELTAAEADRAKRKEEYEARLAAKRADGSNTATASGSGSGANPMADGSQLAAGPAPEAVKESTAAIVEQAEALEELTDAEAGVIDATKRLDQTADNAKGFKSLFDQQRLQAVGMEVGKLAGTVGDLAREFLKTEAGQDLMAGLSEETKTFGGIALQTGAAVAQGWATGGPIGAALAGLNVLVKETGDSFLAVARAEEQAASDLAAEQDRLAQRTRERAEVAESRQIEDAFRRQSEWLESQNLQLEEGNKLLQARAELASAEFGLKQEQERAQGKPEAELAVDKIQFDRLEELKRIRKREFDARQQALKQEVAVEDQARKAERVGKADGTDSDAYRSESAALAKEKIALEEARKRAETAAKEMEMQIRALETRTATSLQAEARRRAEEARRDTTRTGETRAGLGREGASVAEGAAREATDPRQARAIEQIGQKIAADPTGGGTDQLADVLERMLAGLDQSEAAKARRLTMAIRRIEQIEAKLKTREDGR